MHEVLDLVLAAVLTRHTIAEIDREPDTQLHPRGIRAVADRGGVIASTS